MNALLCIWNRLYHSLYRSREVGPETRKELDECVESKQCLLMKEGGFAHVMFWLFIHICIDVYNKELGQEY